MSTLEFANILLNNIESYYLILIFISPLYIYIIYRKALGIFDPLTFAITGSMFATATAVFILRIDPTAENYIFSFFSTELLFLIGFLLVAPNAILIDFSQRKYTVVEKFTIDSSVNLLLLVLFYMVLKIIQYLIVGIPLLTYNRLNMASGGLGVFQTLSTALLPLLCLRVYKQFTQKGKNKITAYGALCIIITTILMDGSKAGVLIATQMFFMCSVMFKTDGEKLGHKYRLSSKMKIVIFFAALSPLALNIFTKFDDVADGLYSIAFRVVAFGDIYYQSYSNKVIETISSKYSMFDILYPLLATFKLVAIDADRYSVGEILTQTVESSFEGGGSNARINIISYLVFENLGFIFSFAAGLLIGLLRKTLTMKTSNNVKKTYIYIAAIFASIIWTDLSNGLVLGVLMFAATSFWLAFEYILFFSVKKVERTYC